MEVKQRFYRRDYKIRAVHKNISSCVYVLWHLYISAWNRHYPGTQTHLVVELGTVSAAEQPWALLLVQETQDSF